MSEENIKHLIHQAFLLVNADKNNEALEIANTLSGNLYINSLRKEEFQEIGDIYMALGKFEEAKKCFLNCENIEAAALSLIFLEKIDEANNLISKRETSPPQVWCNFLIDIYKQSAIRKWPSYLEIRHFMELTIYSLLLVKKHYFISLIIKRLNKLLDINLDSEKLIGYGYLHYGDNENAIKYLKSSIKNNRNDGEIYFMLGQLYMQLGEKKEALSMLENANALLLEHYPTKRLLTELNTKDSSVA